MEIESKQKKIYKSINFWFGIIGVIGVLFAIYTYYNTNKPDLKYLIVANTSVLDLKENVKNLTISYDSINIVEGNKQISVMLIDIKNVGTKDITTNDFDLNSDFGLKILNGILINKPEMISSSDNNYYKDIILNHQSEFLKFNFKLIDKEKFFRVKLLILHDKNLTPNVEAIGKISGLDKIEVLNSIQETPKKEEKMSKLILILSIALIAILSLLSLSLYKNNLLRSLINKHLINNDKNTLESEPDEKVKPKIKATYSGIKLLTLDEILKLKKGDIIYHTRFGKGKVNKIEISDNIKDSKGEFEFENLGIKKLMLRFANLYFK